MGDNHLSLQIPVGRREPEDRNISAEVRKSCRRAVIDRAYCHNESIIDEYRMTEVNFTLQLHWTCGDPIDHVTYFQASRRVD